jgi:Ribonuclease G/E
MNRRLFLDDGPGEARGIVVLAGQPERLLIERVTDRPEHLPGARLAARIRRIEKPLATAFLDMGCEPDAVLPLAGEAARLTEGARIEVEIVAPPRRGKGAVVRLIGPADGEPRLLEAAPSLADRLQSFDPAAEIIRGREARDAVDAAEDQALAVLHRLPSGGALSIEPTRALVAVDVDVGQGGGDARRAAVRANREAIGVAARLLRLKGLGGPVVIDLAGKGHDGALLKSAGEAAFATDQPGVVFGPITRFGLWTLSLPRRATPLVELLCDADGRPTDETLALRLLRRIESAAGPGERIEARAAPNVAGLAQTLAPHLAARIGPRFRIVADAAILRETPVIKPWENG